MDTEIQEMGPGAKHLDAASRKDLFGFGWHDTHRMGAKPLRDSTYGASIGLLGGWIDKMMPGALAILLFRMTTLRSFIDQHMSKHASRFQ